MKRRALLYCALFAVLGLFAWGLFQLLSLRFASGDVYPPYSSLRSDPLGAKVYYESLAAAGHDVRRHLQSVNKLPEGRATTLFVLGLGWAEMEADENETHVLETFMRQGGRLVVLFRPEMREPLGFTAGTNAPFAKLPKASDRGWVNLREQWGFGLASIPLQRAAMNFLPDTATRVPPGTLPEQLRWHSSLVFTNLALPWRILYARGTDPVLIERDFGDGALVLATDAYFVSNEAMRQERHPELLAWLAARHERIVFNETHLGVQEQPGIASLARRYKLHGGVAALMALAALFIWKSAVSFMPRTSDAVLAQPVRGRESSAGFENLLRRSVPARDLMQTCLDEWHKTSALDARVTPPRREKIRAVVEQFNAAETPNLVDAYREIARILNRKK